MVQKACLTLVVGFVMVVVPIHLEWKCRMKNRCYQNECTAVPGGRLKALNAEC